MTDLPIIPGVPPVLVTGINERFRAVNNAVTAAAAAQDVTSVNGSKGEVVLTAQDVNALPATTALGPTMQTQPTRVLGTVYQNTGTRARFVSASGTSWGSSAALEGISDTSATPTTVVAFFQIPATSECTVFFIVLPGSYYKVTAGAGVSLAHWTEWQ